MLVVLPLVGGAIYRLCTVECPSERQLNGKTVIVTGASAGIGKETALEMARRGARVIMACRNLEKSQPIADSIIAETGNDRVLVRFLDLSDMDSVRKFADEINEEAEPLHILINNAGILMRGKKQNSPQGFELTMATNHYGSFLLTNLLIDKVKTFAPGRVVVVSSLGYMLNCLDVDDLNFERRSYNSTKAYCQSKLCNLLFTKELARRLEGSGVIANCLHPGYVATEIFNKQQRFFDRIGELFAKVAGRTIRQGAETSIHLALSEDVNGKSGGYYDNCKERTVYRKANDMELALKLWEQSCKDVGLPS